MAKQVKEVELLNLKAGHPDFVVKPSLGNIIRWHGKDIDLRAVSRKDAEAIAADPNARYISRAVVNQQNAAAGPGKQQRRN